MVSARTRRRKSEKLTPQEFKDYKKLVASFEYKIDAAEFIGVSKPTLMILLLRGTGSPDTVDKIREALRKK